MTPNFTEPARRLLATILETGAERASTALSRWLERPVLLSVSEVTEIELAGAAEILGPGEDVVAACVMSLQGRLSGVLMLVFNDASGLALADLLLGQSLGSATTWGELETSAAMETTNIVGCAYLNAIAAHLPPSASDEGASETGLTPSPPVFRHEFAGSLLEFALMDQAMDSDRLLLANTQFETQGTRLDWSLLLVPTARALEYLASTLSNPDFS